MPDLDAASAKAVGLGAELLRTNENWYTLADPAGHPFDLCLFPARQETTLMGVMLDCPDTRELSGFYAELRGKLLGGCSSTNATFALRGHPADYDAWGTPQAQAGKHLPGCRCGVVIRT